MHCSPTEVACSKAKLEAQWVALLKKNDENLCKLDMLERELDAQEKENVAKAARPPPEQLPATEKPKSAPLTPHACPCPCPASKANARAAADNDGGDTTPAGQHIQLGRIKHLRREDLEAHHEHNSELDLAVPAGATGGGGEAVDNDKEVRITEDIGQAQSASGQSKKRKSDATDKDE